MNLEACLPPELQGPATTIDRIAVGASGAGVYRVEAAGQTFVLKVAAEVEPVEAWHGKVRSYRRAADAGLAPRVVHVDDERRAIVSAFVADRSFPALFATPETRQAALALLGRTLRRVHALPLPPDAASTEPREFLAQLWSALASFALPGFVGSAVQRVTAEEPPARERAVVLSHNDVNPTNLAYDGESLMLLDWDIAGPNDPLYDLATISVFLRMDDATCLQLLAAYDGAPVAVLPARFAYSRRLVAAMCGAMFLHLARVGGYAGGAGETLASTPSLIEFYQRLWSGGLSVGSPEGKWWFGLALVKTSLSL